jgi:hypothetical protein
MISPASTTTSSIPELVADLPCFGMDLMGFFDKKVIIVFDFQHPVENHLFSHPDSTKGRWNFQISLNQAIISLRMYSLRKCTMNEVNNYLDDLQEIFTAYKDMLESKKPTKNFMYATYCDFD